LRSDSPWPAVLGCGQHRWSGNWYCGQFRLDQNPNTGFEIMKIDVDKRMQTLVLAKLIEIIFFNDDLHPTRKKYCRGERNAPTQHSCTTVLIIQQTATSSK